MPQMSPISWTLIFASSLFLMFMMLNSMKPHSTATVSSQHLLLKENKMKW